MKIHGAAAVLVLAAMCGSAWAHDSLFEGKPAVTAFGAFEALGGFDYSWLPHEPEYGAYALGMAQCGLDFNPFKETRIRIQGKGSGEYSPTLSYARIEGCAQARQAVADRIGLSTEVSGWFAEGADLFRDFWRIRAQAQIEIDLSNGGSVADAGYHFDYDELFRISGHGRRNAVFAGLTLAFSTCPLVFARAEIRVEHLLSNAEGESKLGSLPSVTVVIEDPDVILVSFYMQYRYDAFHSGRHAHSLMAILRVEFNVSEEFSLLAEYSFNGGEGSDSSEDFRQNRIGLGFRLDI